MTATPSFLRWSQLRRSCLGGTVVLLALVGAPEAHASQTYPEAVQDALDLGCAPNCTLCHRDNDGGAGTVVKAFGNVLIEEGGLRGGGNVDLVAPAIESARDATCDADDADCAAGQAAIDALTMGLEPESGESLCDSQPKYGCGARIAPVAPAGDGTSDALAAALAALTAAGLVLSRRYRFAKR